MGKKRLGRINAALSPRDRETTSPQVTVPKVVVAIPAGTFDVPGGTLTCDGKGGSRYEGIPAQPMRLKAKYLGGSEDKDERGRVKGKIKG